MPAHMQMPSNQPRVSNKKFIVLLAGIFLLSVILGVVLWRRRPSGKQVVVSVNGGVQGTFDLHTNQTVIIGPEDGSWHNTLVIENGRAGITEADCDNQICVYTPELSEDAVGIIVCLPHGLIVELKEP